MSPSPPTTDRKLRRFGWVLLALSAFMFVSIIVKTALQGP